MTTQFEIAKCCADVFEIAVIPLEINTGEPADNYTLSDASKEVPQIVDWFKNTNYAVGVVTGKVSNLLVIEITDFDEIENYEEKLSIGDGAFRLKTPTGWHYYFDIQNYEQSVRSGRDLLPGVHWYAENGLVVADEQIMNQRSVRACPSELWDLITKHIEYDERGRKFVFVGTVQRDVVDECIKILKSQNQFFVDRDRKLVQLDKSSSKLMPMNDEEIKYALDALVCFMDREKNCKIHCPSWLPGMLRSPSVVQHLNTINGIRSIPIIREDLTTFHNNGYDPVSGYYFYSAVAYHRPKGGTKDSILKQSFLRALQPFQVCGLTPLSRANLLCALLSVVTLPILKKNVLFCLSGAGATSVITAIQKLADQCEDMLILPKTKTEVQKYVSRRINEGAVTLAFDNCSSTDFSPGFVDISQKLLGQQPAQVVALIGGSDVIIADQHLQATLTIHVAHPVENLEQLEKSRTKIIAALFYLFRSWDRQKQGEIAQAELVARQVVVWLQDKLREWDLPEYELADPYTTFVENTRENDALITVLYNLYEHNEFSTRAIVSDCSLRPNYDDKQDFRIALRNLLFGRFDFDPDKPNQEIGTYLAKKLKNKTCQVTNQSSERITVQFTVLQKISNGIRHFVIVNYPNLVL